MFREDVKDYLYITVLLAVILAIVWHTIVPTMGKDITNEADYQCEQTPVGTYMECRERVAAEWRKRNK